MFDLDIAFLIALGLAVVGRLLIWRAFRGLSAEDRVRLVEAFARRRGVGLVLMFALLAAYILSARRWPDATASLSAGFFLLFIAFVGIGSLATWRKIASLQLPARYTRQYLGAQALNAVAVGVLVLAFFS